MAAKPKPLGEFTRFMREHEEALEPVSLYCGAWAGYFFLFFTKKVSYLILD